MSLGWWQRFYCGVVLFVALGLPAWARPHSGVDWVKTQAAGRPVHVVSVDLSRGDLVVRPVVVPSGHRESFGQIVHRTRPVAAINGTFFDTRTGVTVGNLVADGRLLSEGMSGSSLVFYKDGTSKLLSSSRNLGRYNDWSNVDFAVGGGITLLSDGQFHVDPIGEGFRDPSLFSPRPRVAVGTTPEGHLRMVVSTEGVTLWQMAHVMKDLRCYQAINLDGGSSAGLSVGGTTVVRPHRKLTNILGVFPTHLEPKLERAVQVAEKRALAHYQKGLALLAQGDLRLARSHMRQAVAKAPSQAGYWRAAGLAELQSGHHDRGLKDLHQAAGLYFDRGDLLAAQQIAQQILEVNPQDSAAHLLRGECLVEQGLDDEAEHHLQTVLLGQPGHLKATELMQVVDFRRRAFEQSNSPRTMESLLVTALFGVEC